MSSFTVYSNGMKGMMRDIMRGQYVEELEEIHNSKNSSVDAVRLYHHGEIFESFSDRFFTWYADFAMARDGLDVVPFNGENAKKGAADDLFDHYGKYMSKSLKQRIGKWLEGEASSYPDKGRALMYELAFAMRLNLSDVSRLFRRVLQTHAFTTSFREQFYLKCFLESKYCGRDRVGTIEVEWDSPVEFADSAEKTVKNRNVTYEELCDDLELDCDLEWDDPLEHIDRIVEGITDISFGDTSDFELEILKLECPDIFGIWGTFRDVNHRKVRNSHGDKMVFSNRAIYSMILGEVKLEGKKTIEKKLSANQTDKLPAETIEFLGYRETASNKLQDHQLRRRLILFNFLLTFLSMYEENIEGDGEFGFIIPMNDILNACGFERLCFCNTFDRMIIISAMSKGHEDDPLKALVTLHSFFDYDYSDTKNEKKIS